LIANNEQVTDPSQTYLLVFAVLPSRDAERRRKKYGCGWMPSNRIPENGDDAVAWKVSAVAPTE
jgi:hypothetical protein